MVDQGTRIEPLTEGPRMTTALAEYEKLVASFGEAEGVSTSLLFGKPCLKVRGKAFIAQHKETVVFKLTGARHQKALSLKGAVLWDPSDTGRPMKEWVALPVSAASHFEALSNAAMTYVSATA
jgi:hypothetical protein